MVNPTKREAAQQVIQNMTTQWIPLHDLAMQSHAGQYALSTSEMARFLSEHDNIQKKIVYTGGRFGASLHMSMYRKKRY